jgi:AcrR family transcriptional regulator
MPTKQKQPNNSMTKRRDEIISVAAQIFAVKGYHATTLDEIAREIGITKPALYYYINSKEDILREIVGKIMEPMEEVTEVGKSALPPRERLAKIIQMLVKFGAERKETTRIAFEQINILPRRSRDALRRRQKDVEEVVHETIRDGVERGDFAVDDAKLATLAILAVSNWIYRWYQPDGGLTPAQIADQFIHLLENGYIKK